VRHSWRVTASCNTKSGSEFSGKTDVRNGKLGWRALVGEWVEMLDKIKIRYKELAKGA
jgi:hypothetical protein